MKLYVSSLSRSFVAFIFAFYVINNYVTSTPDEGGNSITDVPISVFPRVIRSVSSTIEKIEIVEPTSEKHTGTVIILHGSGGTGTLLKSCIEALCKNSSSFPHLKIMYPTAPERPLTALQGSSSRVWYNILKTSPESPEQSETINSTAVELVKMIEKEIQAGIPVNKIVIGGFSMGGSMAIHLGYRFLPEIGGVFALGSYLNDDSLTYKELRKIRSKRLPPLFYAHGDDDDVVLFRWGQNTFEKLQELGVQGVFHTIPNTRHNLRKGEIELLFDWINALVPNQ